MPHWAVRGQQLLTTTHATGRWFAIGLVVGAFCVPPWVRADVIRLKNGNALHGTVVKRTSTEVIVQLDVGTVAFTPDEIVAIEPEKTPPSSEERAGVMQNQGEDQGTQPGASKTLTASVAHSKRNTTATDQPEKSSPQVTLAEAMKAIAYIGVVHADGSMGLGSGTIINPNGVMVTNYHVIRGAVGVAAMLPGNASMGRSKDSKPYEARVLKTDPCFDLALVSIPMKTPDYLRFAEDRDIRAGQEVKAIGNPQGLAVSVSKGVISSVRTIKDMVGKGGLEHLAIPGCEQLSERVLEDATFIQTDAAINPGNSGGPLLNDQNQIIGINSFGFMSGGGSAGLNFAVHVKHARKFAGAYTKP